MAKKQSGEVVKPASKLPWEVTAHGNGVYQLALEYKNIETFGAPRVLLISDLHIDSINCNRKLLASHLQEAVDTDAAILMLGDVFDVMGGKWDPRADKSGLRPELKEGNYLDLVVDTVAEFLAPYASHIALVAPGNHEASVRKHRETDLIARLVQKLKQYRSPCVEGRYGGFVKLQLKRTSGKRRATQGGRPSAQYTPFVMKYHHGSGGGGPVTKGIITANRSLVSLDGVDIIACGHVHERMMVVQQREYIDRHLQRKHKPVYFLRCSSYTEEMPHTDHDEAEWKGSDWWVETSKGPRPNGGWWLNFKTKGRKVWFDVQEAK